MKKLALLAVVVLGTFFMFLPAVNALSADRNVETIENNEGDPEKKCEKCGKDCTDENCTAKCKKECTKEDCKKECTKDAKCCKGESCKKESCDKSKCSKGETSCKKKCTGSTEKSSSK
jgi:hypothetical protein